MDNPVKEKWKEIKIEGKSLRSKYEVSNWGRIKSRAYGKEKILKGALIAGYSAVRLRMHDGKIVNKYVHRLVAQYFVKKVSDDHGIVIHLDHDKANNHYKNLRWVTRTEQVAHKVNGPNHRRGVVTNAKLNPEKVGNIKKMLTEGKFKKSVIARKFLITHTQLNRIESGRNWKDVEASE